MEVLRTPEERFEGLPGYRFEPHYREVVAQDGTPLRLHFVDEGPRDGAAVLLVHGNPSWSYLHRNMVPGLAARGLRVISLDLMGMGRSDKPAEREAYTLESHVDWFQQWLVAMELSDLTMYLQDWGGLIGLNALPGLGERVSRVIASNTGIPVGEGMSSFMRDWLQFSQSVEELPISTLIASGCARSLSDAELLAYTAPFPDGRYQACAKQFPLLIPLQPENPGVPRCRATWEFLESWQKPFLTVFGSLDPVAFKTGAHLAFQQRIPGARDQEHVVIDGASHFIQEDAAPELVEIIAGFAGARA